MLRIEPVHEHRTPPWWRTLLLVLLACFGTLSSLVYSPPSWRMGVDDLTGADSALTIIGFFVAIIGPMALIWRHRRPVMWCVLAAVASVLLPLGNTLPFITLGALIGRRRGPLVWVASGLTAVTSTWVVVADALAQPRGASFLKNLLGPVGADPAQNAELGIPTIVVVALLGWGTSVGLGLLVRGRRDAAAAKEAARAERRTSSVLGDEVARRAEREQIAREVHDVLGHRLSLLSLHAGAMEANAVDERLQNSAALVRDSASGAMDDLRSLLDVLRQPTAEQPELPLTLLPRVVEESFGAGQFLSSSVFIQDAEQAHSSLSRAVYRIVQELLTNARKHAPGQHTVLKVTGGPASGITIDVRNPIAPHHPTPPATPGSRRGLTGIAERAELLGGTVRHGLDHNGSVFRVEVRLPWLTVNHPGS